MKPPTFSSLTEVEKDWIDAYVDGTISPEDFSAMQERMLESPDLRIAVRRYLAIDNFLQVEGGPEVAGSALQAASAPWLEAGRSVAPAHPPEGSRIRFAPIALAASLAVLLGFGLIQWRSDRVGGAAPDAADAGAPEAFAEGFAVLGRLSGAEWPELRAARREGDTLGAEPFRLSSGVAEIRFFSGATMTVEGPAEISIKSAWEASCHEGAVRMRVPPAARGFRLHAPSTEIIDLGTEFGLVVRDGAGHLEVFEGEVALRHRGEDDRILKKGSARVLSNGGPTADAISGQVRYPDRLQFGTRAAVEMQDDFERWKSHRDTLARDPRLIAYYTFEQANPDALIPNLALPRDPELDGAIVLTEPVDGRWPGMKPALEFRRPGSRVRVNLPGEFSAFTFSCWVRIDSLDRRYNALFMADGYETGEPHWQIRDDGKLMLSVMVDDSLPHPKYPKGRYHHVYFSPEVWDLSMSGQWLHLASVFDPGGRQVAHYANGEQIASEPIAPEFFISPLRIGNGEIGNWGQPFREDPSFAIRNLNGRMDEIAIFRTALDGDEIKALYEKSRSRRQ